MMQTESKLKGTQKMTVKRSAECSKAANLGVS